MERSEIRDGASKGANAPNPILSLDSHFFDGARKVV
jgi:hypothetical protein